MKKVSLLILVSMILLLAFASCDMLPPLFGEEPEPEHVHDWMEATCEAPKTCACGATEGEALPHTWVDATCDSPKVCSFCNKTEGSALKHNWVSADCETPITCSLCGTTSGEPLGHAWVAASCESAKHCANCYIEEGEALGHVWADPTCLTPSTCKVCKDTKGDALGHTDETVPGYAPTCTETGLTDGTKCSVCGETTLAQQVIPALGHTAGEWIVDQNPTCTELGSQHKECTVCQTLLDTQAISALGHTEGEWIVDLAPTCDEKGKQHKECTVCGVTTKTALIPILGHTAGTPVVENNVAPDCDDAGHYDEVVYCATCGCELARNTIPVSALGHTMSTPTCQAPATCTVCGHTEGTVVPCQAGEAVKENEVANTCETDGSYDLATYCVWCNTELSRETFTVAATGHNMAPATCDAPATCLNGCGHTEGEALKNHTVVAHYEGGLLWYTCETCEESFWTDVAHYYDGTNKKWDFFKNGNISVKTQNGEYAVTADDDTRSQYMLYLPSSNANSADIMKDFTADKNTTGVVSFRMKTNATEQVRIILMEARNNNNGWVGWTENSMDVLTIKPNGDGTYTINGQQITSDAFATVAADEWFEVKMFVRLTSDGMLAISYYVNGQFCNVYTKNIATPAAKQQYLINQMIQSIYICGYTQGKDTGFVFDDFAIGYTNDSEWVFDEHEHVWADATCTAPKACTACGLTEGEALGHEIVNHNGQAPTCTEIGWEAYETCARCADHNTYTELPATGHNYGDATCDQAASCTVCGYSTGEALGHEYTDYQYNNDATCEADGTETGKCIRCDSTDTRTAAGTALGHNFEGATCANAAACTRCGKEQGEPDYNLHRITNTYDGTKMVYTCSVCNNSFAVESEGVYYDGNDMTGTTIGSFVGGSIGNYTGGESSYNGGVNKVVSKDGVWAAITDIDADVNSNSQVQLWIPNIKPGKMENFSAANGSVGVLSFDMQLQLDHKNDVLGFLLHHLASWGVNEGLRDDLISFKPIQDASGVTVGYKALVWDQATGSTESNGTYQTEVVLPVTLVEGSTQTNWFNVQIFIIMDEATDTVTAKYYINGELLHIGVTTNTVDGDQLSCLYINLNAWNKGTGYYIDNFAFGHTVNAHNMLDGQKHEITESTSCNKPATCTCGWVGEALPHDLTEATCATPSTCRTCGTVVGTTLPHANLVPSVEGETVKYTCADCEGFYVLDAGMHDMNDLAYVENGQNAFAPVNNNGTIEVMNVGVANGQYQYWVPGQTESPELAGLTNANNATAVLSFSINTKDAHNTGVEFKINANRNTGDWDNPNSESGAWSDSSVGVFKVKPHAAGATSVELTGYNGAGLGSVAITGTDGWTGWLDVVVLMQLHDDNTITVTYYVNGQKLAVLDQPMIIWTNEINSLYINGRNNAGEGWHLKNFYFGYTLNGMQRNCEHVWADATCTAPKTCTLCGLKDGNALGHTGGNATCAAPANCERCGTPYGETTAHANLTLTANDGVVKFTCADCRGYYLLDGKQYYFDGSSTAVEGWGPGTNKNHFGQETGNDHPVILDDNGNKYFQYTKDTDPTYQADGVTPQTTVGNHQVQLWVPRHCTSAPDMGMSSANGALGFVSFDVNAALEYGLQVYLAEGSGSGSWYGADGQGRINHKLFEITKEVINADGSRTVTVKGFDKTLTTLTYTSDDTFVNGSTGWLNLSAVFALDAATDSVIADFYLNGEYVTTVTVELTTKNNSITSLYFNAYTGTKNTGLELDNIVFGYTTNGLQAPAEPEEPEVPEEPFYKEVISKDVVTNELLKAVVENKIKQWDQSSAHNNHNGTPVYVIADRNGEDVQALYFSKTTPWVGDEGEQFSEFRVDVDGSKKATGLTFSYKATGSVEKNDRFTFTDLEGNTFQVDSYVQIKTPANHPLAKDNYPELQNTEFVFDGEWHDVTVVFPEPLEIINVLMCLYHFQGELLIADLEVQFAEEPFYTEEIAKEEVSSAILQTVVTNKIKQWDQSSAHNSHEGTPVFVKADMNGETVTGLYFSKTTPWVGDEGEQFSEFRVNTDGSKKAASFTFVYKVEGTVDENKGKAEGGYDFKDLEGNVFTADAYVQIKTPANHPLAGDNYPELSGTDFILDGEWHTMTYTFAEPLEIINMLFNFYHFQGQLIIANLEVTYVEACQHTNTTTTKVDATCSAEGSNKVVCNDCGEILVDETLPVAAHKLTYTVVGEGVACSCAFGCGEGYTIDKGYYADGTDASLLTPLGGNATAGYTPNTNGSPVIDENGYFVYAKTTEGAGQLQFHYRAAAWNQSDAFFPEFNAASHALGVLEFKLNPNVDTTGNLRFIVTNRVESGFAWGKNDINLLTFNPATADGTVTLSVWGASNVATFHRGEDGYLGWMTIKVTIELYQNDKGENIGLVNYYINGEKVATTHSHLTTLADGKINNLYVTQNSTNIGTGYMLDDLVFGYTVQNKPHEHTWNDATCTAPKTCAECGATEGEALGHNMQAATCTAPATCANGCGHTEGDVLPHNVTLSCIAETACTACGKTFAATGHTLSTVLSEGKVTVVCAGCDRTYACDTSYVYDGANTQWNWGSNGDPTFAVNADGQYEMKAGNERSQYMIYIPSSNRASAMHGFEGAKNSVGVVSFKMKTNATEAVRIILMEARNANPGWIDWSNNSVDVLAIQPKDDGTYKIHGNSMSTTVMANVAADEWFDVQMFVTLSTAETMTISYYINGEFCGEYTKDFNAEDFGMRLVGNLVESLYICGWTAAGTGFTFDDLYIGYCEFGHWTFDNNAEHTVTPATSCTAPATCTCGWVGDVLDHNMSEASCTSPATCGTCGYSTGEALKHNYTTLVNNGTVKYLCEDCMLCYSVETGTLSDGNNPAGNVWQNFTGAGGATFNGNGAYPALITGADGNNYFQYLKAETTGAQQIQIWLPASGGKGLQGFTADTNNVGFFSLDFNANMDHNCEWKLVDFSSDAARWSAEWCIDNPFFRMTTPSNGKVELRGFNGVTYATVELDENNYTGWMNLAFVITLDAAEDLVIIDYYLNGEYKTTMSASLTTKTNGICAVYMNGNAKAAGTGYMVDNIAFGYGSFATHEHTWTDATCTTAKTCTGCGMVEGEALGHTEGETVVENKENASCVVDGKQDEVVYCTVCEAELSRNTVVLTAPGHDFDEANCTSPKTCAVCDATEGDPLGHTEVEIPATDATCTAAGKTAGTKCEVCNTTLVAPVEDENKPALGHADENGDYKCDRCSTKMLPADGEALTIPQAIAVAKVAGSSYSTQKYYITGIVTNVYNTTYGNLYLKDAEGNQICIYGLYSADGKTRYDAMSYKPVEGDELTVYTVLGTYNSTAQGKNAWMDEVVAHTHNYVETLTPATCTKGAVILHTCSICQGYYEEEGEAALGHTTDNGECERCGQTIGGEAPAFETFTADFNTISATNTSYTTVKTTSGWTSTNTAVFKGGTSNSSPTFKAIGGANDRGFALNGKTSAKGTLTSPTLTGGLSKITFGYANVFSESNGVDLTITVKDASGATVATKKLDNNSVTQYTGYEFVWDLAEEGIAVTGDFTIEIVNNCPSKSTKNKDRVCIFNLQWTNNPV